MYHQVKRMVHACGKEVLYLKRLSMGEFSLEDTLDKGAYRTLTEKEMNYVREYKGSTLSIWTAHWSTPCGSGGDRSDYLGKRHLQMPKSLQKDIEGMSMRGDRLLFFKNSLASQMILIP